MHSHSAGTGGWHAGEEMNPPAARQVRARGGDADGFAARKLRSEHIDAADLVLTATADQQEYVVALRPDAAASHVRAGRVRPAAGRGGRRRAAAGRRPTPEAVYARGVALVEAVDAARRGARRCPATTSTTRGVGATSASAGSPTRSRRRSSRWPRVLLP